MGRWNETAGHLEAHSPIWEGRPGKKWAKRNRLSSFSWREKRSEKKGQEDQWSVSKSCQCVGRVPRIPSFKLPPKFRHLETYYRARTSIPSTLVAVGFGKLLETMLRCHYLIPTIICVYCIYRCSFHATLTAIGCYAMYFYRKEKSWYMTHWMKGGVD